jgi:4-oxalocrotonate tautomerase
MPLIDISIGAGRSRSQLRSLISSVHAAVASSLEVPDQNVRIIVREVPRDLWSAGDETLAERDSS